MVNVGKYNRRLTYTIYTGSIPDAYGGYVSTYNAGATTWCSASKLSENETILFGLSLGQSAYKFHLRYEIGNLFDQTTILTYEGTELRIITVNEIDEYKREVMVIANERTD